MSYIKGSIVTHGQDGIIDYLGNIDPFFKAIDPIFSEYFYTKDEVDHEIEEAISNIDNQIEQKINEAINDLDDEIEQKIEEAIGILDSEIDNKIEVALSELEELTLTELTAQNIDVDNITLRLENNISASNSNRKDGIISSPTIIERGYNKAPILSMAIGDITFIRCSSHFRNLIGADFIAPGHEFFVSNTLANNGNGVYITASQNGKFVEPTTIDQSLKVFLGAGRYMAMHGADLLSNDSTVLCKKINHE